MSNEIIKASGDVQTITEDVELEIIYIEKAMKELKEQYDDMKAKLLEEMAANKIIKITTDNLTISYVSPTDRETFDSKAFRKDHPDLYDEYVSFKPVKESVRIKVTHHE